MTKTPPNIDCDAFKRVDGVPIEGHKFWWKFYDFSTVEIYDAGSDIALSVVTKVAVDELHFSEKPVVYDKDTSWALPIRLITDVKRNEKKKKEIESYLVDGLGWVRADKAFEMACNHEIDNARPVFPKNGRPYLRTRRDHQLFNNITMKG